MIIMKILPVTNSYLINPKKTSDYKFNSHRVDNDFRRDSFVSSQPNFLGLPSKLLNLKMPIIRLSKSEALAQGYVPVYTAESLHKALSMAKESKIVNRSNSEAVQQYLNTPRFKIILMRDIKLDKTKQNNWIPIETFGGDFNGNGYKISGLRINQPQNNNIGLFKSVKNAKIENLILEDVDVIGANNTGAIVGINNKNFNDFDEIRLNLPIKNCLVQGKIKGDENVGGIVGDINNAVVENCIVNAVVVGNHNIGGIIGVNNYSEAINNISASNVLGNFRVGGIVGFNVISSVINCISNGVIKGQKYFNDIIGLDYKLV